MYIHSQSSKTRDSLFWTKSGTFEPQLRTLITAALANNNVYKDFIIISWFMYVSCHENNKRNMGHHLDLVVLILISILIQFNTVDLDSTIVFYDYSCIWKW